MAACANSRCSVSLMCPARITETAFSERSRRNERFHVATDTRTRTPECLDEVDDMLVGVLDVNVKGDGIEQDTLTPQYHLFGLGKLLRRDGGRDGKN